MGRWQEGLLKLARVRTDKATLISAEPRSARVLLETLLRRGDARDLQAAARKVCGQFGKVVSLDVVTMAAAGKRQALCFVRLESQAQESALMSDLGALRFGNEVLVVVDLPREGGMLASVCQRTDAGPA